LYGNGFTMYGRLSRKSNCLNHWQVMSRIRMKRYDYIIFGSIRRYNTFFDFSSWYYSSDKILSVDGEDDSIIDLRFVKKSKYFKRELNSEQAGVYPINFSIPGELIVSMSPLKSKWLARLIPGDPQTYIYRKEQEYYSDYQNSIFGMTRKKAGWDCLRHYEILMNGCIPYFHNISHCPENTLVTFPKEIIHETNFLFEKGEDFDHRKIIENLLDYTRENLTTMNLIRYLIGV